MPSTRGSTLLELLIAILLLFALSTLSSIFLIRFVARAKEVEAVTTLDAIRDAQTAHYTAHNRFAVTFAELGLSTDNTPYYRYTLTTRESSTKATAQPNERFLHSYAATAWVDGREMRSKQCKSRTWTGRVPACLPEFGREDGGR